MSSLKMFVMGVVSIVIQFGLGLRMERVLCA
jgi:hypothetical protein